MEDPQAHRSAREEASISSFEQTVPIGEVLWSAKVFILAGAVVSAAFAFISTPEPVPMHTAQATLLSMEGEQLQASLAVMPPQAQAGVKLTVPSGPVSGLAPIDVRTLQYLVKAPASLKAIVERLGDEYEQAGLTPQALADQFAVTMVPQTKLVTVSARMSTPDLALRTVEAVTAALIDEDRKMIIRDQQALLRQLDAQLQALRRAMGESKQPARPGESPRSGSTPGSAAGDVPREAGDATNLIRLMYVDAMRRYQLVTAEMSAKLDRLSVIQPPMLSQENPAPAPRGRNTATGLAAGALLASIAALGLRFWTNSWRQPQRAS